MSAAPIRLTVAPPPAAVARPGARALLAAGSAVAVLDGLFAVTLYVGVYHALGTAQLFRAIASALLGPAARTGGAAAAVLGVVVHTGVAFAWAAVYQAAYRRSAALRRVTAGAGGAAAVAAVYGMGVWLAMNQLIVPLTRARPTPAGSTPFWVMLVGHVVTVGLPVVLVTRATLGGAARGGH